MDLVQDFDGSGVGQMLPTDDQLALPIAEVGAAVPCVARGTEVEGGVGHQLDRDWSIGAIGGLEAQGRRP